MKKETQNNWYFYNTNRINMNINNLNEGESAIIKNCSNRILLQHGFTPGTTVNVYKKILNIMCFSIRGAMIAMRYSDCESIQI